MNEALGAADSWAPLAEKQTETRMLAGLLCPGRFNSMFSEGEIKLFLADLTLP